MRWAALPTASLLLSGCLTYRATRTPNRPLRTDAQILAVGAELAVGAGLAFIPVEDSTGTGTTLDYPVRLVIFTSAVVFADFLLAAVMRNR